MRRVGVRLHACRGLDGWALLGVGYAVGRYHHAHSQQCHYNSSLRRPAVRFHVRCAFHSLTQHWQGHYIFRPERPNPVDREKRLPRLTRLLALAVKCEGLVRSGAIPDYAELARRGWVTRARITQIMNLLHLASPIQEEILHWPDGTSQREPVSERALRRLTQIPSWSKQLGLWRQLLPAATGTAGKPVALEEYAIPHTLSIRR